MSGFKIGSEAIVRYATLASGAKSHCRLCALPLLLSRTPLRSLLPRSVIACLLFYLLALLLLLLGLGLRFLLCRLRLFYLFFGLGLLFVVLLLPCAKAGAVAPSSKNKAVVLIAPSTFMGVASITANGKTRFAPSVRFTGPAASSWAARTNEGLLLMTNLAGPWLSVCPELLTYVSELGLFRHGLSSDHAVDPGKAARSRKHYPNNEHA